MYFENGAKVRNVVKSQAKKPKKPGFQGVKSRKKGRNSQQCSPFPREILVGGYSIFAAFFGAKMRNEQP